MDHFKQGQKIKFERPTSKDHSKSIGHAPAAGGARIVHNGEHVFLEFGRIYQVSENTSAEVANMDHSPLPLIKAGWVNNSPLKSTFTLIESEPDND